MFDAFDGTMSKQELIKYLSEQIENAKSPLERKFCGHMLKLIYEKEEKETEESKENIIFNKPD